MVQMSYNTYMKKNFPLIVGMALPFLFIIIIAAVVYLPSVFINPKYDFVYTTNDQYNYNGYLYQNMYEIKEGKVVKVSTNISTSTRDKYDTRVIQDAPKLYRYDMNNQSSH
jgi:hypothetical protein